ncbi:MAG: hypothetical protein ABJL44_09820 [Algibacter sp.]
MEYTEEDIRKAFQAGMNKGSLQSYYVAPLFENEFIEQLKKNKKTNDKPCYCSEPDDKRSRYKGRGKIDGLCSNCWGS